MKAIYFVILIFLGGCFLKPVYTPPWPGFPNPSQVQIPELISALDQRNSSWKSAHAKVHIQLSSDEGDHPKLSAELFMKKPDQIRLRAYNPLGLIAFDLLYHDQKIELYLPHRKEVVVVPIDQKDELNFGDTPLVLPNPQDWWRILQPWQGLENRSLKEIKLQKNNNPASGVLELENDQFTFNWKTGRITHILLDGHVSFQYEKWRSKKNMEYASWVEMKRNSLIITMDILKITWDPTFPDAIFKPVNKSLITTTNLGQSETP